MGIDATEPQEDSGEAIRSSSEARSSKKGRAAESRAAYIERSSSMERSGQRDLIRREGGVMDQPIWDRACGSSVWAANLCTWEGR